MNAFLIWFAALVILYKVELRGGCGELRSRICLRIHARRMRGYGFARSAKSLRAIGESAGTKVEAPHDVHTLRRLLTRHRE